MAFGDTGIGRVNIGLGLLARPFIAGMKFTAQFTKKTLSTFNSQIQTGVRALRTAGAKTGGKNSFLSPEWFANRARWFVQLRAFWALWQSLSRAVAGAFEFEQEMANVRAITQATNDQFEALRTKALEVGKTTRFSAAEAAKGMVVMSQAGLSAKEVIESITAVANLAVATMNDFRDTASLIVTIMRAWKKPAEDATEISDILATSINKTKLNMDALANGFKFVSGIAPQLGVSLEETTALLGILANRGLSASVAATSLRSFMAALLSPTDKFTRVLGRLGLTLDDVDPRINHMATILERLRQAGFGTAEAFQAFRRRAAAGASILIGASAEFENLSKNMNETGRSAEMAALNLDTVQGQTKQLQDTLVALAADINRDTKPALKALAQLTKLLAESLAVLLRPLSKVVNLFANQLSTSIKIVTRGFLSANTDKFTADMRELNNQISDQIDKGTDLVNKIRELRTAYAQWQLAAKEALGEVDGILRPELLEKALTAIRNAGLLTDDEFETVIGIADDTERRAEAERIISERIKDREADLKGQWALTQRTLEALEETALQMALPGVSPAFFQLKDAMDEFIESGKAFKTVFEKTKPQGAVRNFFARTLGWENFREGVVEVKKMERTFKEFFLTSRIVGEDSIKLLEKHNPLMAQFVNLARESGGDFKKFIELWNNANATQKESIELTKEENELLETRTGITPKGVSAIRPEDPKLAKRRLSNAKDLLQAELKLVEADLQMLQLAQNAVERRSAEDTLLAKIRDKKEEILKNDFESNILGGMSEDHANALLQLESTLLDKGTKRNDILRIRLRIQDRLAAIQRELGTNIKDLEFAARMEELRGNKEIDRLETEEKRLELQKRAKEDQIEELMRLGHISDENKKIRDLRDEIREIDQDITENAEKQLQATNAIARIQAKLKADPLNFRDAQEFLNAPGGIIDTLHEATGEGLTVALTDIANLWAGQREEVAGLEQQLDGLNREYQEALSQGNIERARQLEMQMANIRGRIDDLNNPLKNLANTFKQFALTVVQELQKVIIKMLVMKLISSALNLFGGGGGGFGFAGGLGGPLGGGGFALVGGATGGIFPGGTFKSFRRFANGGVTGGPGAAILGDNPSGKELVIPSENIQDDQVSGTVRDQQQPINIINVLTEQDIANAMARTAGQRVIINTIGKDIGKRGPTYRAINT